MGVIIFNGVSSENYGIHVETPPAYAVPERDYEVVHIPGRNGDLVIDNGSYKNVDRTYDISFGERNGNFTSFASGVTNWLHSVSGYARLEDSYEPDYYRMAYYSGDFEIENIYHQAGKASLEFTCKPARYLKSGEESVTITETSTLVNPTAQKSLPKIILNFIDDGSGLKGIMRFYVNDHLILGVATSAGSYVIDSEMQDVYDSETHASASSYVSFYLKEENADAKISDFPYLQAGTNTITIPADLGSNTIEIVPRWWTL